MKAFNHIPAAALTTDGQAAGTKNRRALVIAGDDQSAKATVTRLLDEFGFDTVDAGPLKEGPAARIRSLISQNGRLAVTSSNANPIVQVVVVHGSVSPDGKLSDTEILASSDVSLNQA